jgi:nucleoid-associated protein YgaU
MYAAGHGITPWRANRAGGISSLLAGNQLARLARPGRAWPAKVAPPRQGLGRMGRLVLVLAVLALTGFGMAVAAHGGGRTTYTTVVVQPGDTLWSIAAQRYPDDDVRDRVQDIEQANGLTGPEIRVGEVLRLP